MKNDILIDAIGLINEETIKDAKTFQKKAVRFSIKKGVALVAAVILCFTVSISAFAITDVESVYQLLYAVSPSVAQKLKPIRKSCVDNGIQMEVVSAYVHNNTAEIYIAMKDLEGNRIDRTTDLFDSYYIHNSYDSIGTCEFESYDDKTGIVTFLITIEQMDEVKIRDDKVTFSVSEFLSHKNKFEDIISDIDLSSVSKTPTTQNTVDIRGGDMSDLPNGTVFLKPEASVLSVPIEGVSVTAIGYINEKLHVQLYYDDILNTDNHGWLWLKDTNGNFIECIENEAFWDSTQSGSYEEYIFDIPYDELGNYNLYGEFTTCRLLTEGNWQVTFSMSDFH